MRRERALYLTRKGWRAAAWLKLSERARLDGQKPQVVEGPRAAATSRQVGS